MLYLYLKNIAKTLSGSNRLHLSVPGSASARTQGRSCENECTTVSSKGMGDYVDMCRECVESHTEIADSVLTSEYWLEHRNNL